MRVLRQELRGRRAHVREITATTARDTDFFAGGFRVVNQQDVSARMSGAHHASSTGAKDQSVYMHAILVT